MSEKKILTFSLCLAVVLGFSVAGTRGGNILFISAMDDAIEQGGADDVLKVFMEGLGHTVTYFDDNESEADTEIAAAEADLVFISESVSSGQIREEITEIETPMIVSESWAWDEMGLTSSGGGGNDVATTDIEIVAPEHPLAAGLSGTVTVLTDITGPLGTARLSRNLAGSDATVIATATLSDGQTYDVLFIYEKGATLPEAPSDGSPAVAADMRICLGFDERSHPIWNDNAYALLTAAIQYTLGMSMAPKARNPEPSDGAIHSEKWVKLSWRAGDLAVSHDVYMGNNFDDVDNGAGETFRGNQDITYYLAGFTGYAFPDGLVHGTTYYWRIDEVNDADPNSPWKGDIWSFTVPPRTAYNPDPADGAGFVDPNATLSWAAGLDGQLHTVYIGTDFDDVNDAADGASQGWMTYSPGTLESGKVYYWRVDEYDSVETFKGDIWSFTTPGAVDNPVPAYAATDVKMTATLSWTPADSAASHEVYFGTDKDAVRNADKNSPQYKGPKTLGAESYDPGKLAWYATYYWRVDEVDSLGSLSKGPPWSFTTADFISVDDFEDYDVGNKEIWWAWKDGLGYAAHDNEPAYLGNGTGSAVGDETTASYTEETIVRGGQQSMPLLYDNNKQGYAMYSEVELMLSTTRDWTEEGVVTLTIWFRGESNNDAESLYVAISNSAGTPAIVVHDDPAATTIDTWTEWVIPLQALVDQGFVLTNVDRIVIGLGTQGNMLIPGGSGKMYFDDIRLYQPREVAE